MKSSRQATAKNRRIAPVIPAAIVALTQPAGPEPVASVSLSPGPSLPTAAATSLAPALDPSATAQPVPARPAPDWYVRTDLIGPEHVLWAALNCNPLVVWILLSVGIHFSVAGVWWWFSPVEQPPVAYAARQGRASLAMQRMNSTARPKSTPKLVNAPLLPAAAPRSQAVPEPVLKPVERVDLQPTTTLAAADSWTISAPQLAQSLPTERPTETPPPSDPPRLEADTPRLTKQSEPIPDQPTEQATAAVMPSVASTASSASTGVKVDVLPRGFFNPEPVYPSQAQQEGRTGIAWLALTISTEGQVKKLRLQRSSGHADLDQAALQAVRAWRFHPAKLGGRPIEKEVLQEVRFTLSKFN